MKRIHNNKREGTFVSFFCIMAHCLLEGDCILTDRIFYYFGKLKFLQDSMDFAFAGFQFHHNITKHPCHQIQRPTKRKKNIQFNDGNGRNYCGDLFE